MGVGYLCTLPHSPYPMLEVPRIEFGLLQGSCCKAYLLDWATLDSSGGVGRLVIRRMLFFKLVEIFFNFPVHAARVILLYFLGNF